MPSELVKIADYPELYLASWPLYLSSWPVNRDMSIDQETAFLQYQAGWNLVCVERMDDKEWDLLLLLVEKYGPIQHKHLGGDDTITMDDLKARRANLGA